MSDAGDDFAHLRTAKTFSSVVEWEDGERFLFGTGDVEDSLYAEPSGAVHFDGEGRWTRAKLGGRSFLRGLDGKVLERFAGPGRSDVSCADDARAAVHSRVHGLLSHAARSGRHESLTRAAAWSADRLEAERARFLEVYRPLGVMPPDRYRSLIVQVTWGCAYNGCLFCELYRGQRARVVPPDELRGHLERVKAFVGSGLRGRRGVFLGEANALATPQPQLLESFALVEAALPELVHAAGVAGGVASFVDAFTSSDKGVAEYRALHAAGLRRVFVGVESGDAEVLAFLRKPESAEGVRALVGPLKEAGVSVAPILLVGAGGRRWCAQHVEHSAALIASLPLDEGDVVYLSPLVAEAGGRFGREALRAGVELPSPEELTREEADLRAALAAAGVRAQLARYDVRRFVY